MNIVMFTPTDENPPWSHLAKGEKPCLPLYQRGIEGDFHGKNAASFFRSMEVALG
jgi:hypothetical protein